MEVDSVKFTKDEVAKAEAKALWQTIGRLQVIEIEGNRDEKELSQWLLEEIKVALNPVLKEEE